MKPQLNTRQAKHLVELKRMLSKWYKTVLAREGDDAENDGAFMSIKFTGQHCYIGEEDSVFVVCETATRDSGL